MFKTLKDWLAANDVEEFVVDLQPPIFWPDWAREYYLNRPVTADLEPGDILMRCRDTERVWVRRMR